MEQTLDKLLLTVKELYERLEDKSPKAKKAEVAAEAQTTLATLRTEIAEAKAEMTADKKNADRGRLMHLRHLAP